MLILPLVGSFHQQVHGSAPISSDSVSSMENPPSFLYKVLSMDDWAKSREVIQLSSADADFIHFSTEDQLNRIVQKYWGDVPEYVVLKIETAKLSGELVFEANPGGTAKYYHLYNGSIPLTAVAESNVHTPQ